MEITSFLQSRKLRRFGFLFALFSLASYFIAWPAAADGDVFYLDHNMFSPSIGSLTIQVNCEEYPGNYSLKIFNTAGEFIRDLSKDANNPSYLNTQLPPQTYYWDGTNTGGSKCASGVYFFHLVEPTGEQTKRVILVR